MKKITFLLFFVFLASLGFSQSAPLVLSTKITINSVTSFTDPYTVVGTTNDVTSNWVASDIAAGDSVYLEDGNELRVYYVQSITSASSTNFTIVINDMNNTGSLPPTGVGALYRGTTNYDFPNFTAGISESLQTLIQNRFVQRLDALIKGISSNFSTQTVNAGPATLDSVVTFLQGTTSAVVFPDGVDGMVRWVVNERVFSLPFTVHASDTYEFDDNKFIPAGLTTQYIFNSTDNEWKVGNYQPLMSTTSFNGGGDPVVPFFLKNRDAGDIDIVAGEQMQIDTAAVAYVDLEQAVKDTIGTYWKKTGRVVTSNSDVHVVVADSASISSAKTILSASTNIYLNPTGELILGNGSGTNLPTTNSDHLGMDLGYDGTGVLVGSQKTAKRNLIGLTDPVSGSTIAFYNGQLYTNSATGDIFVATTASANPDLSGTGSTWVKVSDGGSVTISDTLNDFPAATSITASEKLVMPDSTVTWQKVVNQIRDSTLFGDGISEGTLGRGMLGGTYMLNHVSKFSGTRKINLNTYDLIFGKDTDSTLFRFNNTVGSVKGFYIQPSSGGIDYKYLLGNSVTNWAFSTNSAVAGGALQIGQSGTAPLLMITTGLALGIGTGITSFGLPQRFFHVESPTSKTNSIEYYRYGHITDASATTGFGFGTEIELENASASKKIVATTKYVYTDATAGSEDVDYIVGNIVGGTLADRLYLRGSKLGIGVSSPTSSVDVQTGSATQAPLKFTVTGAALLTTPVMGNVEVLGNKLFYTDSTGVRCEIQKIKKKVTGAGTLTLTTDYSDYIFTGTTSTWTLPSISNGDGVLWRIKNRGSGNITINSASGGNDIYDASAVSTYTVAAGSAIIILNDGTYFNIQ